MTESASTDKIVQPRGSTAPTVVEANKEPSYLRPVPASASGSQSRDLFEGRFLARGWNVDTSVVPSAAKRRALVIAISYGLRSPPAKLEGTYTDAYKIINLLVKKFKYPENEICVLADPIGKHGEKNRSHWPSQENIEQALRWLNSGTRKDDYRFLYFAGHGHRRVENSSGDTYEGIMPADVDFTTYTPCANCACGLKDWSGYVSEEGNVIPYPRMIVWDYTLNEILASSLADGANLTVVFDCCHSGGTLKKSLTGGVDQMTKPGVARGSGISRVPVFGWPYDQIELRGNLLCLPKRVSDLAGESGQVLDTTQPRSSSVSNACDPHLGVKPTVYEFGPNCRVLCWAACSDVQRAYEDDAEAGGRFTRVCISS